MVKFFLGVVVGIGLVVLASYLFVARGGIFMGTDTKPLPLEETIAGSAISASIGKSANDPSPLPADETNLLAGAKVYMQACAGCHGKLDQASSGAKGFYPLPPHLLPPGTGVTDKKLSDSEIWQVSLLLRNANKLPASVQDSLRQPQQQ